MQCSTVKLKEGGPQEASLKGVKGCKDCTRWYASSAEAPRYTTWKMPICICNTRVFTTNDSNIQREILQAVGPRWHKQSHHALQQTTGWHAGPKTDLLLYDKKQRFVFWNDACNICVSCMQAEQGDQAHQNSCVCPLVSCGSTAEVDSFALPLSFL